MQPDEREIEATYRLCTNGEIAELAAQRTTLTEAGCAALDAEIARRGLSRAELEKEHRRSQRHEEQFDKLEGMRRKKTALGILTHGDPKGTIVALGLVVAAVIATWLMHLVREAVAR